ncbi:PIN domain-containing protein [Marinoscillum furvescens]|uniref:Putative nucleic acid-binding protein n=1 Tax=Marinoscillum furvescens DSM 4134 TaxID=1122208 RepID=A0A3D9KZ23_MARFU|nr:PIN domain-containing protein [Marinoscillum furvescens]RED92838.1 putative nucleic acid-binding protein [Marinoscillum furvescens DSM 4134]
MIKVLLDTNIVLDIALRRIPHYFDSESMFRLISEGVIEAYISATTVTDLYYISAKQVGGKMAREFISSLIEIVHVAGVDEHVIREALNSNFKDFEDGVQHFTAEKSNCEVIISRNIDDFKGGVLPVRTPKEFIENLK